ncbi:dienelactone hydrolase family protein [Actinomadura gamaensis]|uniref:Poly(ethylene terephthalate) hydrolase n=1 Tax=Actinomadura gamaensis TaxID=1763541 RepID=A0ABV9U430_9ACTN
MKPTWTRTSAAGAALAAAFCLAAPADAGANPYERGPAPTQESITAERGPFAIAQVKVPSRSGAGFNDGTIYYPTDTSRGRFGAVAVMPGFNGPQASVAWYGPRLASQGFVVMTLDSISPWDQPAQRGRQLLAALRYLTGSSAVRGRVDPARLAVMGHSMGGGGILEAEAAQPSLKAAVALAPWDLGNPSGTSPTMIIGATGDRVASVGSFAERFYRNAAGRDKALVELNGGDHLTFIRPDTTVAKYSIAWLKRFVDDDTRYDRFLCPAPAGDPAVATFTDTCPL